MLEIEKNQITRYFETFRLKDKKREEALLLSISERGIREALLVVEGASSGSFILLDGYKRLRCSDRLGIEIVPIESLGKDPALGILQFLNRSQKTGLHFLEEASLVDELKKEHKMSINEIARDLERSNSWVSLRVGVVSSMTDSIREEIFSGRFPARSYLYSIKPFTRVKEKQAEIESFVKEVSGKGLSVRKIDDLAYAYFRGDPLLKEQIHKGNLEWTLTQIQEEFPERTSQAKSPFNKKEKQALCLLERTQSLIKQVSFGLQDSRFKHSEFFLQANLWVEQIIEKTPYFLKELKAFYDQRR